jgi:hypothetical protein
MKRQAILALLLAGSFAIGAHAQVVGYNIRTGDVWVDSQLGYVNDFGRRDRNYFVDDLVESFGAPRYLVNDLLDKRRWEPGDVYYASALAYAAHRPLGDIARDYEQNRGQGWGVMAQRLGIKPGSAEFHALKGQMGKSKGRFETHGKPPSPGNSGKGHGHDDADRDDDGPGNSGKAKGQGQGNSGEEKGKGNGKGKSKGKPA